MDTLLEVLKYASPAVITLICNVWFYQSVKKSVDESSERLKISFSGVFTEKMKVYNQILDKYYELLHKIESFGFNGSHKLQPEIHSLYNNFVHYRLINEPLISESLLNPLKLIEIKLEDVYGACIGYYQAKEAGLSADVISQKGEIMRMDLDKLKETGEIGQLQMQIVKLIRDDIHLSK